MGHPCHFPALRPWRARCSLQLVACIALVLPAVDAAAQFTRDRSAREKIAEAIEREYVQMNFGQAEEMLLGVISACDVKCRPATLARAWMYAGIVRGSGKGDQDSARQAFDAAFSHDPGVELDVSLATPETQATFAVAQTAQPEARRRAPGADPATPAAGRVTAEATYLTCSPEARTVQTRRAVPVECRADEEVVRMTLRYQEHGGADWKTLDMTRARDRFRATLPCEATMDSGRIRFFIVASDAAGDPLDTLGSKSDPQVLTVDPRSQEAPAYPGEDPPPRCEERVLCPPDFPGCDDPTREAEPPANVASGASHARHWFGLHFAADVGFMSGSDVCTAENRDFDCFAAASPYPSELPPTIAAEPGELGDAYPGTGIGGGASAGTLRVLLSYDRALSARVSLGGRLGYAFRGGPETLDGRAFLPLHAEARLSYWLRALNAEGLRPYLHLGGGAAQVDIKKSDVTVRDCSGEPSRAAFLDCISARNAYDSANDPELPRRTLDAYRKLGNAFVTTGGGVLWALGESVAVQLNVNAMLMLPSTGFVVQPSLGLVYGIGR